MGLTLRGAVAAASRRVVSIKMVLSNGNLLSIYCSELQQQQHSEMKSQRINHDSHTGGRSLLSLSSLSLSLSLSFLKTDSAMLHEGESLAAMTTGVVQSVLWRALVQVEIEGCREMSSERCACLHTLTYLLVEAWD